MSRSQELYAAGSDTLYYHVPALGEGGGIMEPEEILWGFFLFSFCFHYGTVIVNPMEVRYLEVLMGGI